MSAELFAKASQLHEFIPFTTVTSSGWTAASVLPLVLVAALYYRSNNQAAPYPPGPPSLPVIGNILEFPRGFLSLRFTEWAKRYGDVIFLKVMNKPMIVLNSPTLVKEVYDKRSLSNSNRPASAFVERVSPGSINFGTTHHANQTWKILRKPAQAVLTKERLKKFASMQEAEASQLMIDFVHDPKNWFTHINRFTTSYTLAVVHGTRGPRYDSPQVKDFLDVHHRFMDALDMGTQPPIDIFTILQYVPKRFAEWKREADTIRNLQITLYSKLLTQVKDRMARGYLNGCFMEEAIPNAKSWGLEDERYLQHLAGTLIEGSDTTSVSMQYMVLCAMLFPDKAQIAFEELDRVVGKNRLPRGADLDNLPYTNAFAEECSRFFPPAHLGLPHEMCNDEIIDGYLYPKGAVVFQNTFMFHDERYYDKPFEFLPERFLKHPLGVDPSVDDDPARRDTLLFGGGRRICPGFVMAKSNIALVTAMFLWGFDIKRTSDIEDNEIQPDVNDLHTIMGAGTGITATPLPFPCQIKPRSKEHAEVMQAEFTRSAEFLRPFEYELNEEDKAYNAKYRDI